MKKIELSPKVVNYLLDFSKSDLSSDRFRKVCKKAAEKKVYIVDRDVLDFEALINFSNTEKYNSSIEIIIFLVDLL